MVCHVFSTGQRGLSVCELLASQCPTIGQICRSVAFWRLHPGDKKLLAHQIILCGHKRRGIM
jgi:hypothetical protein